MQRLVKAVRKEWQGRMPQVIKKETESQSRSSSRMGVGSMKKIDMSYFRGLVRKSFHWGKSVFI